MHTNDQRRNGCNQPECRTQTWIKWNTIIFLVSDISVRNLLSTSTMYNVIKFLSVNDRNVWYVCNMKWNAVCKNTMTSPSFNLNIKLVFICGHLFPTEMQIQSATCSNGNEYLCFVTTSVLQMLLICYNQSVSVVKFGMTFIDCIKHHKVVQLYDW